MELQELQLTGIERFFFKKKIKSEDEKLFIMRYQVLGKSINGLTENFIVDLKRLRELVIINGNKSYCKFYYTSKNGYLNLGLSFSDNDKEYVLEGNDILYLLDKELFIIADFETFNSAINDFKTTIGSQIESHTGKQSNMISYEYDVVDFYIKSLTFHFSVDHLIFNMIQYRSTDLEGEIIPNLENKDDRISFCVHPYFNSKNGNVFSESNGYDLGNLMP